MKQRSYMAAAARRILFVAVVAASGSVAYAGEGAYGFGVATERSSNIRRSAADPVGERINSIVGGIAYGEDTADFTGRVAAQVEHRDYVNDTFDDEAIVTLDAAALWTIVPGRFAWTLADSARRVTLNPTLPDTPTNRAASNVIETGPDVFFHFNPRQRLVLGARAGNVYVGDTVLDNNRYGAMVRWVQEFAPQLSGSVNAEHLSVRYDDDSANDNFDRRDFFLRVDSRRPYTEIALDAGVTRIQRERAGDLDGSLLRLRVQRTITGTSHVGLSASAGYFDIGGQLLRYVTPPRTPIDRVIPPRSITDVISSDINYTREADLFYGYSGARFGANARLEARNLEFETAPTGNRDESGIVLDLSYNFSVRLVGGMSGSRRDIRYREIDRDDQDQELGVRLSYRVQRNLVVTTDARRTERDSSVATADFVDKRFFVSLMYSTGSLYNPSTRR